MSLRSLRFVALFILGLPAHLPTAALAQRPGSVARAPNIWSDYLRSGFDDCDAKVLAGYWQTSRTDAKKMIGQKVRGGGRGVLTGVLNAARKNASQQRKFACDYHEAGYSYSDADLLSKRWAVSVGQAKRMIADKILWGGRDTVNKTLGRNVKRPISAPDQGHHAAAPDPWNGWIKSGYDYCDAVILGRIWGQDTYQAKKTVGRKVHAGARGFVHTELKRARKYAHQNPSKACSYTEAGFSYADVTKLAERWRVDVGQAKKQVVHKVIDGQARMLRKQLSVRQAPAPSPTRGQRPAPRVRPGR